MGYRNLNSLREVKEALREGRYAWPDGYPLFFTTASGDALSFGAVRKCWRDVCRAYLNPAYGNDWLVNCVAVNWDDDDLRCEYSGELIEAAYV